MGEWFGKDCEHHAYQLEDPEDQSSPALVFCSHKGNPETTEGNCNPEQCPLKKAAPVKRIVQVVFAGNYERKYDFFTDLDLQLGDFVVCDTFRGYSVAKVVSLLALTTNTKADKWIVQVVDVVGHAERMRGRELADLLG